MSPSTSTRTGSRPIPNCRGDADVARSVLLSPHRARAGSENASSFPRATNRARCARRPFARSGTSRAVYYSPKRKRCGGSPRPEVELPPNLEILDPSLVRASYVAPLVEIRKHKGLTPQAAAELLEDSVWLGTMMLAAGEVDGLVSGAVHSTANTVRPAFQIIRTRPGAKSSRPSSSCAYPSRWSSTEIAR